MMPIARLLNVTTAVLQTRHDNYLWDHC